MKDAIDGKKVINKEIYPDHIAHNDVTQGETKKSCHKGNTFSFTPQPVKVFTQLQGDITPFDHLSNSSGKQTPTKYIASKTDQTLSDKMPHFCKEYDFLVDIISTKENPKKLSLYNTSKDSAEAKPITLNLPKSTVNKDSNSIFFH
jgi:hypothetical protein